jgi:hypothetical protein
MPLKIDIYIRFTNNNDTLFQQKLFYLSLLSLQIV